jgi:hypothetical protein
MAYATWGGGVVTCAALGGYCEHSPQMHALVNKWAQRSGPSVDVSLLTFPAISAKMLNELDCIDISAVGNVGEAISICASVRASAWYKARWSIAVCG